MSEPAPGRSVAARGSAPGPGGEVVPLRREREHTPACPLGKCDGTGWVDAHEGAVAPCECRDLPSRRAKGVASTIPPRYRGVSLDRPPVSDMARAPESRAVVRAVSDYVQNLDARLDEGRGLWLS